MEEAKVDYIAGTNQWSSHPVTPRTVRSYGVIQAPNVLSIELVLPLRSCMNWAETEYLLVLQLF